MTCSLELSIKYQISRRKEERVKGYFPIYWRVLAVSRPICFATIQRAVRAGVLLLGFLCCGSIIQADSRASSDDRSAVPLQDAQEVWSPRNGHTRNILDDQTRVTSVRAFELRDIEPGRIGPVQPAVRKEFVLTGERKPPVQSVRCDAQGPILKLPASRLAIGCYAVRVIGMVPSSQIEQYRRPLYVELSVQGPAGVPAKRYRQRVPYWDDFYSVTELYFNVDVAGEHRVAVSVGSGSLVTLHVNRLELHDVLQPLKQVAAKTKPAFWNEQERAFLRGSSDPKRVLRNVQRWTGPLDPYVADPDATPELTPQQRTERDSALWHAMPPLNSQFLGWFPTAFPQREVSQPRAVLNDPRYKDAGQWQWTQRRQSWLAPLELVNETLNLRYSPADFANYRPLPSPFPWQDDGGGVYIPALDGAVRGENYALLATRLTERWTAMAGLLATYDGDDIYHRTPLLYHALGNRRAARDAALMLCHWAYIYPTFTQAQVLDFALISPASIYNRDLRLANRYVNDGLDGLQAGLAMSYDLLFDYIHGNDELAQAVNRFIPWVKTEADVRRLIETRILQFGARQLMYFNLYSDAEHPRMLFRTALIQQDSQVTQPWMEFLWNRTWIYPHNRAGLPEYISTGVQRDGSTEIGSIFYTGQGSPLADLALWSRRYVANGGDPRYDLTDPRLYAKLSHAGRFLIDRTVAGGFPMAIGDVGDPDQPRMFNVNFLANERLFRDGYALSGDPRLAWIIGEYFGRGSADDATWQRMQQDRDRVGGHPLLSPNPRVMSNWAGILESGGNPHDFRSLTAAYLRVGTGLGHHHNDTLDLQINALGRRMVNDLGWRDSYSTPKAGVSQLHNLVEVDEQNWHGHSWVDTFVPGRQVSYLRAQAVPPENLSNVTHRSRAISLVEVSTGKPGTQLPGTPQRYTNDSPVPADAVLPQRYVFDVQRTAGGKLHTWCFHGTISDAFELNSGSSRATLTSSESNYLRRYLLGDQIKYAAPAPATLVATWRVRRDPHEITATNRDGKSLVLAQRGGEATMLGGAFDPASPRCFTRVHLVDHGAPRVLVGHPEPNVAAVQQTWPFVFVQREAQTNLQTVFASVIEPYSGDPFIRRVTALPIGGEMPDDARRAVALEVELMDGRRDICFSDAEGSTRTFGGLQLQAQYAFVRTGPAGLEILQLIGGTILSGPWGELTMDHARRDATVVAVDYLNRRVTLQPHSQGSAVMWMRQQVEFGNESHRTSFAIIDAQQVGSQIQLTLDKPIDLGYAQIVASEPDRRRVKVSVLPEAVRHPGMSSGLRCTRDATDKNWMCRLVPGGDRTLELEQSFTSEDFPIGGVLRLWEIGPGDDARLVNHATVRPAGEGRWDVSSNAVARFRPAK